MEDEIFGPILPILTFKSFDEAMKTHGSDPAGASPGLSSARDEKTIDRYSSANSPYGGGGVNLVNVHLFV